MPAAPTLRPRQAPPPPPGPRAAPACRKTKLREVACAVEQRAAAWDVYFDLDNAAIKDEGRQRCRQCTYLKRWTAAHHRRGHCDERATAEYNLGLGERRANAVKNYLVELGVPGDRIVIVSKGEESPFCSESNEACWQQNRRGHFIITAK